MSHEGNDKIIDAYVDEHGFNNSMTAERIEMPDASEFLSNLEVEERLEWYEKKFQDEVNKLARENGWRVYHTHRSDHSEKGFPDCLMVRGDRMLIVELKSQRGGRKNKLSKEQKEWLEDLAKPTHPEVLQDPWYPEDWERIKHRLR